MNIIFKKVSVLFLALILIGTAVCLPSSSKAYGATTVSSAISKPSAVKTLSAKIYAADKHVTVSWPAVSGVRYMAYVQNSAGTWKLLATTSKSSLYISSTTLTSKYGVTLGLRTYRFKVTTYRLSGTTKVIGYTRYVSLKVSSFSKNILAVNQTKIAKVTRPNATKRVIAGYSASKKTITVSWYKVTGSKYKLYMKNYRGSWVLITTTSLTSRKLASSTLKSKYGRSLAARSYSFRVIPYKVSYGKVITGKSNSVSLRISRLSRSVSKSYTLKYVSSGTVSVSYVTTATTATAVPLIMISKSSVTLNVGDTLDLSQVVTDPSKVSSSVLKWSSSDYDIVSFKNCSATKNTFTSRPIATIVGNSPGKAILTMSTMSGDLTATCSVTVTNTVKPASTYGFYLGTYGGNDKVKLSRQNSRNSDGSNTYTAKFHCNGNEPWIDSLTFDVEDVTPVAYAKMYRDMGLAYTAPTLKMTSARDEIKNAFPIYEVLTPFTADGPPTETKVAATAGKNLEINASMGTRVIKINAKLNGKVLDTVYISSTGCDSSREYAQTDLDLYKKVRQKVESKLWTPEMTNVEKLSAVATYINDTTHYPYTDGTSKEGNPTFWNNWSVDGLGLFYNFANDPILNRIMDLQGGITTCQAASILSVVAEEDMGLTYLYDPESDVVAEGEGVWLGMGSHSSSPTNPAHESLIYKDSSEAKTFIDAQGKTYSGAMAPCEAHHCADHLISLTD